MSDTHQHAAPLQNISRLWHLPIPLTSATRCRRRLSVTSVAVTRDSCLSTVHRVHFVVKNLEFGSAHQRGIQPAYALRQLFGMSSSVIDCTYFCREDNIDKLNIKMQHNSSRVSVFVHMDVPCRCVLDASNKLNAVHILEVMDTIGRTPAGFVRYIVASESVKVAVSNQMAKNGMHVPVSIVHSFDSNLLGRGDEMRSDLRSPVRQILYMGSKPAPEMVQEVRAFLAQEHRNISLSILGTEIADKISSSLRAENLREADVDELWTHSVAYSDAFALEMSARNAIAIVWDQCSEYTSRCQNSSDRK